MSSGAAVVFNDPRRFGYMKIIARHALEEEPLLSGLGPEPLGNEFDAAMLARSCANRKTSLKAALLDQRVSRGSATSMSARRCFVHSCRHADWPRRWRPKPDPARALPPDNAIALPGANRLITPNAWSMQFTRC